MRSLAALIAINGLSIIATGVDANTNDPSQVSTEVHWPAGYSPGDTLRFVCRLLT